MDIQTDLGKLITDSINSIYNIKIKVEEINFERPSNREFGDWSTNVALVNSKLIGQGPREIAKSIVSELEIEKPDMVEASVAGPGFINFRLRDEYFIPMLEQDHDDIGRNGKWQSEKVIIEFTDPNPFKQFHIGHLYSNTVGESIARLFEYGGAEVKRADYFGDVGMHVAKTVWGVLAALVDEGIEFAEIERRSLNERIEFLGESYAKGATKFIEDESAAGEIKVINSLLFKLSQKLYKLRFKKDPIVEYPKLGGEDQLDRNLISDIYFKGRQWSLDYFEAIYTRIGMKFDLYYPESVVGEVGYQIVQKGLEAGIFKESDGAIIFPGEDYGLHNRVFINSIGLPTYETKELGLAPTKFLEFEYDKSYIITGNEIDEYFKVLLKAMEQVEPELGAKTKHLSHGMVKLPDGKMSSRTGRVITGEWLINEAIKKVELVTDGKEAIDTEKIGISAIKFAFLKQKFGGDVEFDFDESLSFEGKSGPYVQYAYARAKAVLSKVGAVRKSGDITFEEAETELLRLMTEFPEVVSLSQRDLQSHHIANYLYELAHQFNGFYAANRIVDAEGNRQYVRVKLLDIFTSILRNGMHLLGMNVVDKM